MCQVFKEVTLELSVDESFDARLRDDVCVMKERDYRQMCSSRQQLSSDWAGAL